MKEIIRYPYMTWNEKKIMPSRYYRNLFRQLHAAEPGLRPGIIDLEFVYIYEIDKDRDIEIAGVSGKTQKADIYLWNKENGYRIVRKRINIPHKDILSAIAEILAKIHP